MNKEIIREIKKHFGTNKVKENTAYRNLGDTAKTVIRRECMPINYSIKKEAISQIKNPIVHSWN